jgi:hypothetical protein
MEKNNFANIPWGHYHEQPITEKPASTKGGINDDGFGPFPGFTAKQGIILEHAPRYGQAGLIPAGIAPVDIFEFQIKMFPQGLVVVGNSAESVLIGDEYINFAIHSPIHA